jgi:hypothetical protein
MPEPDHQPTDAFQVAGQIAAALDRCGEDYALGGAIALAYWAVPRGTLDVDLTVFYLAGSAIGRGAIAAVNRM